MSKSIYDEVLDILVDSFTDPQDEDNDCYMFNHSQMNKISKAIREAQKQEKLLELYKTPHQRLLDMGFIGQEPFSEDYRLYKKGTFFNIVIISFNIKDKDYVIWKQDDEVSIEEFYPVNLELAEILVDYLKELENDK